MTYCAVSQKWIQIIKIIGNKNSVRNIIVPNYYKIRCRCHKNKSFLMFLIFFRRWEISEHFWLGRGLHRLRRNQHCHARWGWSGSFDQVNILFLRLLWSLLNSSLYWKRISIIRFLALDDCNLIDNFCIPTIRRATTIRRPTIRRQTIRRQTIRRQDNPPTHIVWTGVLESKIEPPLSNLACINWWNTL